MGDRKARLAALAAKAGRTKERREEDKEEEKEEKKTISFRNYAPRDASMDKSKDDDANNDNVGEESPPKKRRLEETTKTASLSQALAEAQNEIAKGPSEGAMKEMAPKKINWDLKRDIESKLAKLERRTQRAIVELLKERLAKEAEAEGDGEEDSSELD